MEMTMIMIVPMFQEHINDNDNDRSMTRGWFRSLEEKQLKQKQQELAEQQQKVEESWLQIKFSMIIDWHVDYNGGRDDECIDDNDDAEQIVAALWW